MTNTLKAGDTVWTVEGECIRNFDDDYYDIQIPTYVCSHTVKEYIERSTKCVVITTDGVDIFANIKCTYYLDRKSDLYVINLTNVKEV